MVLPASPWTRRTRAGVAVAIGLGLALLIAGYTGADGKRDLDDEIGALNLAIAGVLVASAAEATFLLIGRRKVTLLRRDALTFRRDVTVVPWAASAVPTSDSTFRPALVRGTDVTVIGSTWYHRPDCLLVAGKASRPVRPGDELDRCAVCHPERP
ncbi:MAG TPA: hypothetical protein VEG38_01740 [Acidimicrobiia bacterium]|nr:hypothetical protein [Acidimicrobiia bacterium]